MYTTVQCYVPNVPNLFFLGFFSPLQVHCSVTLSWDLLKWYPHSRLISSEDNNKLRASLCRRHDCPGWHQSTHAQKKKKRTSNLFIIAVLKLDGQHGPWSFVLEPQSSSIYWRAQYVATDKYVTTNARSRQMLRCTPALACCEVDLPFS